MLDLDNLIKIEDKIYYLPSENAPVLSADIGVFIGGKFVWCYDCGASQQALYLMKSINNAKVTISHFHRDHTFNHTELSNIKDWYVSKYTCNHMNKGFIVENDLYIEDDGLIHIFPMPNSHCKGSLALEINEKYVFLGDSVYGKHIDRRLAYNQQLLIEQLKILNDIKADKCLVSHDENYIIDKADIIAKFEKILSKKKSGEPLIIL